MNTLRKSYALLHRAMGSRAVPGVVQRRFLNLHEYQSKGILASHGVAIQRGFPAGNVDEAKTAATKLDTPEYIVKAQVHAGGRGKGHFETGFQGGVHMCKDVEEVQRVSREMLGHRLITHQTTAEGIEVKKVLVAECLDLKRELYLAMLLDRGAGGPVVIASQRGGMDIETVAQESPEEILTEPISISSGPTAEQADRIASFLGFEGGSDLHKKAADQVNKLYEVFCQKDCTLLEINPLAETPDGRVVCVDAKFNFDDNAEFRQNSVFAERDWAEEDPRDKAAHEADLNYIGLDGNIGCLVNGAGLAMATMDIIKHYGGEPANFLDVGGSATKDQVVQAFRILTSDSRVKAILVNIFGGIMKCDTIAAGVVDAAKEVNLSIPLVVRLEGTNVEKGVQILKESKLNIVSGNDLDDAAQKAVASIV